MRPALARFALLPVLALALGLTAGCDRGAEGPAFHTTNVTGQMPDLKLGMPDAGGEVRRAADFRDRVVLLYTGYTHCPDVCPMTLGRIKQVMGKLGKQADEVAVLFVTVDPERDTPEVMRRYTANFDMPQLTGIMGEGKAFAQFKKRFHIYVQKEKEGPEDEDYLVNHSSQVFVFDPQGEARLIARLSGKNPDPVEQVAQDVRKLLEGK